MGTHLVAWYQSTHNLSLAEINVVQDDIMTVASASRFLVPTDYNAVLGCAALGNGLTRAQLKAPSLAVRRETNEIIPRVTGAAKFSLSGAELDKFKRDLVLDGTESITVIESDAASADFSHYALMWFKKPGDLPPMPDGDIRIVRATGTTTLVKGAWTSVTITLDSDLEPGQYALVGMVARSANAVAARAIITGQNYRPGVPAFAATEALAMGYDHATLDDFEYYNMGQFAHTNIPQIQFLADAADTTETVFLFIIKVGGPPSGGA